MYLSETFYISLGIKLSRIVTPSSFACIEFEHICPRFDSCSVFRTVTNTQRRIAENLLRASISLQALANLMEFPFRSEWRNRYINETVILLFFRSPFHNKNNRQFPIKIPVLKTGNSGKYSELTTCTPQQIIKATLRSLETSSFNTSELIISFPPESN